MIKKITVFLFLLAIIAENAVAYSPDSMFMNDDFWSENAFFDFSVIPHLKMPSVEEVKTEIFAPCPVKYDEETIDAKDITSLNIIGGADQRVQVHLFGTKNPVITVEALGENLSDTKLSIHQKGDNIVVDTPDEENIITYNVYLPNTMNVNVSGGNVLIKEQNMTHTSRISLEAAQEYSVHVVQDQHANKKHAYVCEDLSCAYEDFSSSSGSASSYVHKVLKHPSIYSFRGSESV